MHDIYSTIGTTPVQMKATERERRRLDREVSLPNLFTLGGFFPPVFCTGIEQQPLRCIGVLIY